MRCVTQHPICLALGLARAFTCAIQSAVITADLAKIQTAPPRNEIDCIDQREVGSLRAMALPASCLYAGRRFAPGAARLPPVEAPATRWRVGRDSPARLVFFGPCFSPFPPRPFPPVVARRPSRFAPAVHFGRPDKGRFRSPQAAAVAGGSAAWRPPPQPWPPPRQPSAPAPTLGRLGRLPPRRPPTAAVAVGRRRPRPGGRPHRAAPTRDSPAVGAAGAATSGVQLARRGASPWPLVSLLVPLDGP